MYFQVTSLPDFFCHSPFEPPPEMRNVFDDFRVAGGGLTVVGRRGQGGRRREASPFSSHPLHFAFLCLAELRRYDDKAEVDHEK